jgi:hypothetical protein
VGDLGRLEGTTVTAELLKEAGLIRSASGLVKILAAGEVTRAYSIDAHKFSGRAVAKIEAAGGSTTVLKSGGSDSRDKGSKLQKKRGPAKAAEVAEEAPAVEEVASEAEVAEEMPVEEVAAEAETETEASADTDDAPAAEGDEGEAETDG